MRVPANAVAGPATLRIDLTSPTLFDLRTSKVVKGGQLSVPSEIPAVVR